MERTRWVDTSESGRNMPTGRHRQMSSMFRDDSESLLLSLTLKMLHSENPMFPVVMSNKRRSKEKRLDQSTAELRRCCGRDFCVTSGIESSVAGPITHPQVMFAPQFVHWRGILILAASSHHHEHAASSHRRTQLSTNIEMLRSAEKSNKIPSPSHISCL